MSVSLDSRIQWLHKQIFEERYPNAYRIAEKFGLSHRQAQRDIDYLKNKINAPLAYDSHKKGFYYSEPFSLPSYKSSANEESYSSVLSKISGTVSGYVGEVETLQMQIPYSAELMVGSKLGALELKDFIVASKPKNVYLCEFHNVDLFLGMIFTLNSDVKILSPEWLAEKAVQHAERIIKNNKEN